MYCFIMVSSFLVMASGSNSQEHALRALYAATGGEHWVISQRSGHKKNWKWLVVEDECHEWSLTWWWTGSAIRYP